MSEGSGSDHAASRQDGSSAGPSGAPDGFSPAGLKVLVVDDDLMCLKVVSAMLQRCSYEVTTSSNGNDALALLRERHEDNSADQFDLVLSDVYMPDMDGFKLLEHIGLELDLPVIMMSSNGDTNVVLRGVTHGAVDFLIKPVRIEELRNVWQHVVRRRSMALARHTEEASGAGSDDDSVARGRNHGVKRKESEASPLQLSTEPGGSKKPRVVWSVEMHQQFVNAVNTLGIDKAVPKRILDLMNVEGLTRENVASHLQKYRLYLKRVEGVQCGGGGKSHKNGRNQEQPAVAASQPATAAAALQVGAYGGLPAAAAAAAQQQALQKQQQAAAAAAVAAMGAGVQGMQPQGLPPGLLGMGPPPPTALPPTMHQAMAMQAAAAAAAASGALPGSMPPPFMPPGMVPPGVPGGMPGLGPMMGQPPVMPGMDMSALSGFGNGMMFAQHAQQAAAPPASMPQLASMSAPSLPPASMGMCPPVSSGDVLQGLALPSQNAAAAAVAAAAAQQQHSGGGGGLLGPGGPGSMGCQIPGMPGPHTSALLGDETPDLQEQRLLPPTTQEAPLTLGGCFASEDPLGSGNPLGEMTFLGELGAAGVKAEPDDFLDLFLKDSMNEEL